MFKFQSHVFTSIILFIIKPGSEMSRTFSFFLKTQNYFEIILYQDIYYKMISLNELISK